MVKPRTIWTVMSLAASSDWEIQQVDVNNTSLKGVLKKDMYMSQLEGFKDKLRPNYVCKLNKALYGLKQTPRAWFEKLRTTLVSWGFLNTQSDTSLFVKEDKDSLMYVLVYMDDILVTGNNTK